MAKQLADIQQLHPKYTYQSCGCGQKFNIGSVYEVYRHKQLHCQSCMEEAIDSKIPVLVRKVR